MVITFVSIILVLVIAMGIVMVLMNRKRVKEGKSVTPDYRGLRIFGTIIVPFSIIAMVVFFVLQIPFYIGLPLFALGVTYLIIGLANRDKRRKSVR